MAVLAVFSIYPTVSSVWLSLHAKHVFEPTSTFVGLQNYLTLLKSEDFWLSLSNGVIFGAATVSLQLLLGIGTALLLQNRFRGRGFVRGLVLLPFVVPTIVAVLIWKWMLNDLYGVVNLTLVRLGIISDPILWFASPSLAMATVIFINVWLFFPFITIHALARLQMIPAELYDAARVDGAGALQRFHHVILPQLRSTILLVVFIRFIWQFNKFDSVWLLTEGGPLGATQTLPLLAYLKAFGEYQLGLGAAVATSIFLILSGCAVLYSRAMNREME
ncbi:MAG: carbohydrate ABC transporter permease [Variibacter sp.]